MIELNETDLIRQAESLIEGETDRIALYANLSSLIHESLGAWWTGFYRVCNDKLVLGPFQGPLACTRIAYGKGVCGTAWKQQKTQIVPDMEKFPGHIACSSLSRSEIVVPVWEKGRIIAVLDIDSRELNAFDRSHAEQLETICAMIGAPVTPSLKDYVKRTVIPQYDNFDSAHRRDHVRMVIDESLRLAVRHDVNPDMVYAAAAWHDMGLVEGRETHHIVSGRIIRQDARLKEWFTPVQIETIARAAQEHRASSGQKPTDIYGLILAEADKHIDSTLIIRRVLQYGLSHFPEMGYEEQWERCLGHLVEKYGRGGYLKLWFPDSPNAVRLEQLQELIDDRLALRKVYDTIYAELK